MATKSAKIIRKPIHIPHNRRNARINPEFLDCDALLCKFAPMVQSLYKYFCSYCGILDQPSDCEDLYAQIQYEFLRLCHRYDPRRGVDFTGYIKFNLRNRIYYYVCKLQKYQITEQITRPMYDDTNEDGYFSQLQHIEDTAADRDMEQVEMLASIPWHLITDELDKDIIHHVMVNHETLEYIAKVKNLKLKVVKDRFNNIIDTITSAVG